MFSLEENMRDPSPAVRSLKAKSAAHASWAATDDPTARTAPGRAKFLDRFEEKYAHLPEPERKRRAAHARQAYFAMLAARSAEVRQARKKVS
jgi:hypothetical protein